MLRSGTRNVPGAGTFGPSGGFGIGSAFGYRSLEGRLRPGAQGLQMGRGSKLDVNDTKEMRSTALRRHECVRLALTHSRHPRGGRGGKAAARQPRFDGGGKGWPRIPEGFPVEPARAHAARLDAHAPSGHHRPAAWIGSLFPYLERAGMTGRTPPFAGAAARWGGRTVLDLPVCRSVSAGCRAWCEGLLWRRRPLGRAWTDTDDRPQRRSTPPARSLRLPVPEGH